MKITLSILVWFILSGLSAQNGKPVIEVDVTDISCFGRKDGRLELRLSSGALPANYQWSNLNTGAMGAGQFTALNQPMVMTNLSAGMYSFTCSDANGADTVFQRILLEPPPLKGRLVPLTGAGGYQLICAGDRDAEVLLEVNGGSLPLSLQWSNGDVGIAADSLPAGPVSVSITDVRGCMLQLDTVLREPTPIVTVLELEGETCFGQNSGRISYESVSGGVPPYLYSLNGNLPGNKKAWTNLPHGQYFLYLQDALGCVHVDGAILPSGLEFTLDLGPDTFMLSGDTLRLPYYVDPPADTLIWAPAQGIQLLSDTEMLFFPAFTTSYQFTAFSADGCVATDVIVVNVDRHRDYYVPNVFAPQAQNVDNRRFTVYGGPGIRAVVLLQVYDRFGRLWFETRQFPVNDPDSGWNGADGSDQALPGVYLWRAVLQFSDGREERLQGDVTVLR